MHTVCGIIKAWIFVIVIKWAGSCLFANERKEKKSIENTQSNHCFWIVTFLLSSNAMQVDSSRARRRLTRLRSFYLTCLMPAECGMGDWSTVPISLGSPLADWQSDKMTIAYWVETFPSCSTWRCSLLSRTFTWSSGYSTLWDKHLVYGSRAKSCWSMRVSGYSRKSLDQGVFMLNSTSFGANLLLSPVIRRL